jgi:hypothetical protein
LNFEILQGNVCWYVGKCFIFPCKKTFPSKIHHVNFIEPIFHNLWIFTNLNTVFQVIVFCLYMKFEYCVAFHLSPARFRVLTDVPKSHAFMFINSNFICNAYTTCSLSLSFTLVRVNVATTAVYGKCVLGQM